jgi:hypothetical protein
MLYQSVQLQQKIRCLVLNICILHQYSLWINWYQLIIFINKTNLVLVFLFAYYEKPECLENHCHMIVYLILNRTKWNKGILIKKIDSHHEDRFQKMFPMDQNYKQYESLNLKIYQTKNIFHTVSWTRNLFRYYRELN